MMRSRAVSGLAVAAYQGACGAAGLASAPGSALRDARPAHARPHRADHANQDGSHDRRRQCYASPPSSRIIVQLAATESMALPRGAAHDRLRRPLTQRPITKELVPKNGLEQSSAFEASAAAPAESW